MGTPLDVLKHEMVPDHQIMSEEEVADLLATYNITLEQLPKIYNRRNNSKVGADPSVRQKCFVESILFARARSTSPVRFLQ